MENRAMINLLKEITLISNDNLLLRDRIRQLELENRTLKKHINESTKVLVDSWYGQKPPSSKL